MPGPGLNRAQLIGNLGRDAEVRKVAGGSIVTFDLAVNEPGDEPGTMRTSWHKVVVKEPGPTLAASKLLQGTKVFVEGSIQHRPAHPAQGSHKITELVVTDVLGLLVISHG